MRSIVKSCCLKNKLNRKTFGRKTEPLKNSNIVKFMECNIVLELLYSNEFKISTT